MMGYIHEGRPRGLTDETAVPSPPSAILRRP